MPTTSGTQVFAPEPLDPIAPCHSLFSLGWSGGVAPDGDSRPTGSGTRPFGLTLAKSQDAAAFDDISDVRYCERRQMSVMHDRLMIELRSQFVTSRQTKADNQIWTDNDVDRD